MRGGTGLAHLHMLSLPLLCARVLHAQQLQRCRQL
eukprot:COSAG01_NODE_66289_length_270_cov_1.467836_1_plen_34_part_01